jgi:antitoxin (DNA-binding transcriptional repressor) of toxin-antitoxin stability system
MRSVAADNVAENFDTLLDAVEHGETVHVIKDGATVAKLVPGHGRVVDRLAAVFEMFPADEGFGDHLEETVRELRASMTDQEREWQVD